MVEYGSIEIGGQTYVYATRSVALSVAISSAKLNNDWASDATSPRHRRLRPQQRHRLNAGDSPAISSLIERNPSEPVELKSCSLPLNIHVRSWCPGLYLEIRKRIISGSPDIRQQLKYTLSAFLGEC